MNRRISWLMGALAYVVPPTWAYFEQASLYEGAKVHGGYICGLAMLGISGLACLGAASLSGIALVFGWLSYRSLPKPRSRARMAELALLAIPMCLGLGFVGLLMSA